MEQKCPYCGAALPQEASFCPHCAQSVNRRTRARAPVPFPWRKVLRRGLPLLVVLVFLLGWYDDRFSPAAEVYQRGEENEEYRFPICLFINQTGNDANAFMKKVDSVTTQFGPLEDGGEYATYTDPAPNSYFPEAALASFVAFLGRDYKTQGAWIITMKNGDVIHLHQTLNMEVIKTLNYYP